MAIVALAATFITVPEAAAAEPQAGTVPAPAGRYGGLDLAGNMVMFTVRNRKIVNPRVAVAVTCQYPDGTSSEVTFGPTSSNNSRSAPIPANGNGSIAWVEESDSSLLKDVEVSVNYTFRRGRSTLASVDVLSRDPEATCEGSASFRLNDSSAVPPDVLTGPCRAPAWWPRMCTDLGLT